MTRRNKAAENREPLYDERVQVRILERFMAGERTHAADPWRSYADRGREAFALFLIDRAEHAAAHLKRLVHGADRGDDHAAAAAWFAVVAMHAEAEYGWRIEDLLAEGRALRRAGWSSNAPPNARSGNR